MKSSFNDYNDIKQRLKEGDVLITKAHYQTGECEVKYSNNKILTSDSQLHDWDVFFKDNYLLEVK